MTYKSSIVLLLIVATQFFSVSSAQTVPQANQAGSKYENWYNLDLAADKKFGMSVDRAYEELLKGKKSKTIVVAIIDSGVDIFHEDLQGKYQHHCR